MLIRLPVLRGTEHFGVTHPLDLRDVVGFLWREWLFILSILAATVVIGTVMLLRQTPLYTASSEILLDSRRDRLADPVQTDMVINFAEVENQMEIIRSTALLRRVVEKDGLEPREDAAPGAARAGAVARTGQDVTELAQLPPDVTRSIQALKGGLQVTRSKGHLITVSYTSSDPRRAATVANAVAAAYIVDKLDTRYEGAKRAAAWLTGRIAELRNQVRDSEKAVEDFREKHQLQPGTANLTLNQQHLADLTGHLAQRGLQ